jgi:hypothetical protein
MPRNVRWFGGLQIGTGVDVPHSQDEPAKRTGATKEPRKLQRTAYAAAKMQPKERYMPKGSKIKLKATGDADIDFGNIDIPEIDPSIFDFMPTDADAEPIVQTRYTKPKVYNVSDEHVTYDNALKLAKELRLGERYQRAHCLVSGDFIFGDFIEAYIMTYKIRVPRMTIATLSLNQNNVDSLYHLMRTGHIERLNLVVSAYFYGNERHALIPYIYEHLDMGDRFQLAVAGIHTKTTHFNTAGGKHIVIQGSANLRSSGNVEQFTIEENKELFDWYEDIYTAIIERYKTINHDVRHKELWAAITTKKFND